VLIKRTLVLASASPRRREILSGLGLSFEVLPSRIDEQISRPLPPGEMVEQLALRKAEDVARSCKYSLVIGADTVVVLDGEVLGKPADRREAYAMLKRLQGRTHQVYSGLALVETDINGEISRRSVRHRITQVHMRPMSPDEIEWYIYTKEPMDKAGSYGIQGLGSLWVTGIDGCYTNVVGLSVPLLYEMVRDMGYSLSDFTKFGPSDGRPRR